MARVMTGASWRQTLELLSAARDITVEDFDQNDPSMLLATLRARFQPRMRGKE